MKETTKQDLHERAKMVVDAVRADLDRAFTHDDFASLAGYSPFHFQRAFKALLGETPAEMLRRFRLERAAQRLATTDQPIGDIAFDAQFESHESFSRAFRIAYGVTAREFRGENLKAFQLASPVGLHYNGFPDFTPLDRRKPTVPYEIRQVPPFTFSGLKHKGSFQFAHRTWNNLLTRMGEEGINPMPYQWMNLADELSDRIPISEIQGEVGMNLAEQDIQPWMHRREVAGGEYLTATQVGNGSGLVDFWYRLFFECLPHSGRKLRQAPLYQATPGSEAAGNPQAFKTTVFIPVE